jgi:nucleotide-binding universal stress UspA family protein
MGAPFERSVSWAPASIAPPPFAAMPLKDIFLHADSSAEFRPRMESAVDLAARHRAHLTAVYVPVLPREPARVRRGANLAMLQPAMSGADASAQRKANPADLRLANAYERLHAENDRAKEAFLRHAERAGVAAHWVYEEAELLDALSLHARFCDVLVITQPAESDRSRQMLLTLGLPILMLPRKGRHPTLGRRILVAWDRSPVALRAVNNARPFLREAEDVLVLSVNLEPIYRGATDGSGIIEHLARHDIRAKRLRVNEANARLSEVILASAAREHCDLVVMGAFGKRGLRERMLGGVTSTVIADTAIPLLLSH